MADYVNVQNLLVRDCGQAVPSDQEVLDYYGVSQPTPTPTPTPTGLPTTANFGIAGILFAGVLALPILSGLGKWK